MRALLWMAALGASGCGRIGFDAFGDGGTGGDGTGGDGTGTCLFGPWQTPTPVAELNTVSTEQGAQVAPDGLAIYFDSSRLGSEDLYIATRSSRAAAFGTPQPIAELDSGGTDEDASVTPDQLEIFFTSDRTATTCLVTATRGSVAAAWGSPQVQNQLCDNALGPFISGDGLALYYNTPLDTQDDGVVTVSTRTSRGMPFQPGTSLGLSVGADTGYPALSADQLTIYFDAVTGPGSTVELWTASRPTTADAFGPAIRIAGVNLDGADTSDASITADGLELYFTSNRPTNTTFYDLFVAKRACL